eukprot:gene7711-7910_t
MFCGGLLTISSSRSIDARQLQQDAYTSWKGQDPGGSTDSFALSAEASSASQIKGVYYASAEKKVIVTGDGIPTASAGGNAGDREGWSGPLNGESAFQRGIHAMAVTYLGARAVAGSQSSYGTAQGATVTNNWNSFKPYTSEGDHRKSVAFGIPPPNSVAVAGTGNGPAAVATGHAIGASARSYREKDFRATVGSRDASDKFQSGFEMWRPGRRSLMLSKVLLVPDVAPAGPLRPRIGD